MEYKIGDWIRFYTNSLRGPGATPSIGEITRLDRDRDGNLTRIITMNAVMGNEVLPSEMIGPINIESLRQELNIGTK